MLRTFWIAAIAAAIFATFPAARLAELPWHRRALVGMEVGPTGAQFGQSDISDTRYAARFDGREIVRKCAAANAEYVVLWARDGDYAYYDSRLLPKAPGLGKRDPLRDAVDEAKKVHIPVIAYCVVQQAGHFLTAHPEFEMRGINGERLGRFCLNSGYLESMKLILSEQLACGVDGFHIDMVDQGFGPPYGCWCDSCQTRFQKQYSRPMPRRVGWDEDWDRMLEFRYTSSDWFEKAITHHVRAINPAATVDFNYHGNPPFSFEVGQRPVQHADNGDFVTGETGVWGFSALTVGLNAAFYRAAVPGRPFQIAMQRGVRMYHDQTTRPLADIRWELFTLLAHGAFVTMVDKTTFDGRLDSLAYERTGAAFHEARAKHQQFGHRPVAEVGLYFSSRTRDWVGREKPFDYFQSFLGAHKALVYEHIPFGVILDENVSLQVLKSYPVVLLPNTGILSKRELDLISTYVDEGGKLLVTGLGGCYDSMGNLREKSDLEKLVGARFVRKLDSMDNWYRFSSIGTNSPISEPFAPSGRLDWPFLVKGPAAVFEPASARAIGDLLQPYRTMRQKDGKESTDWPMSFEKRAGPAMLINTVGWGTVLTFTGSPDFATATEHHIAETRRLIRSAVRFLNPRPLLSIQAPANVETVITDEPASGTLRIHLIGYNSPPQTMPSRDRPYVLPTPMEEAPMYRISIDSTKDLTQVEALNKTTSIKRIENHVQAIVNDVHEVLILKY